MKTKILCALVAAVAAMGFSSTTVAAGKERVDLGKTEYLNKCAVCHGRSGKGDGGAIDILKKAPTDLTILSKKNGGVFPFDRVYAVIDGREVVLGHGDRDMPIWGNAYKVEKVEAAEHYFDVPYSMETYVSARILALIDYLNRIQVK